LGCGEGINKAAATADSDAETWTPSPVNWVMAEIFCGKIFLISPGRSRTPSPSNWNQFHVPLNNSC